MSLTLPAETLAQLRGIASLAGVTLDQVFAVIVATKLRQMKRDGARP
jgi:hypothetical protein